MAAVDGYLAATLSRTQLLDLLEGQGSVVEKSPGWAQVHPHSGQVVGLWPSVVSAGAWSPPSVLLVPEGERDDFLAWSLTYARGIGPITAQARVFESTEFYRFLEPHEIDVRSIIGGAVGIVLCEAHMLSRRDGSRASVGSSALKATLSYALLRALHVGLGWHGMDEVADTFQRLRSDLQRPYPIQSAGGVARIIHALFRATNSPYYEIDTSFATENFCRLHRGESRFDVARQVLSHTGDLLSLGDVGDIATMTAEDRVILLDHLAPQLVKGQRPAFDRAFGLALATFVCRPGLEQQIGIIDQFAEGLPEAWLWLGALQSLAPVGDTLGAVDASGWWLAREILRDENVLSVPRADVAYAELSLMLRKKSRNSAKLFRQSRIEVELAPLVSVFMPARMSSDIISHNLILSPSLEVEQATNARTLAERALSMATEALELVGKILSESRDDGEKHSSTKRRRRR